MRKHAAATALVTALITMLALTISESLTPANAGAHNGNAFCDNVVCFCQSKRLSFAARCEPKKHRLPCDQALTICIAKCGPISDGASLALGAPGAFRGREGSRNTSFGLVGQHLRAGELGLPGQFDGPEGGEKVADEGPLPYPPCYRHHSLDDPPFCDGSCSLLGFGHCL
jgi:hypothetical protein